MKLTTMTQVTVDGVMQGNGGASDEDRRNGFERGGWAMGVFDDETLKSINQTYQSADGHLTNIEASLAQVAVLFASYSRSSGSNSPDGLCRDR